MFFELVYNLHYVTLNGLFSLHFYLLYVLVVFSLFVVFVLLIVLAFFIAESLFHFFAFFVAENGLFKGHVYPS